jgi:hypothetical protein
VLLDRERIARDLHDLVVQRLYVTGMSLQGATPLITRPEASRRVSRAVDALDETIREIRTAIFALQILSCSKTGSGSWLHRGRPWPEAAFAPTRIAGTLRRGDRRRSRRRLSIPARRDHRSALAARRSGSCCLRRWVLDDDHALTSVAAGRRAAARRTNPAAWLSVSATGWPARNSW